METGTMECFFTLLLLLQAPLPEVLANEDKFFPWLDELEVLPPEYGVEISPRQYPWLLWLSAYVRYVDGAKYQHPLCAAVLIHKTAALTSAQCVQNSSNTFVVAGAHDRTKPTFLEFGESTTIHFHDPPLERGEDGVLLNDIAIIVNAHGLIDRDPLLQPIALPDTPPNESLRLFDVGWRDTLMDERPSKTPRYTRDFYVESDDPRNLSQYGPGLMYLNSGNTDCVEDLGAPVVHDPRNKKKPYILYGVLSFTPAWANCTRRIATNVFYYVDWIKEVIEKKNKQ